MQSNMLAGFSLYNFSSSNYFSTDVAAGLLEEYDEKLHDKWLQKGYLRYSITTQIVP